MWAKPPLLAAVPPGMASTGALAGSSRTGAWATPPQPGPLTQPVDCCICLCSISPFQALFVAPCSHCYHFKCVQPLLNQGAMFLCPLCRQVANLAANVQEDELDEEEGEELESWTGVAQPSNGEGTFASNPQTPPAALNDAEPSMMAEPRQSQQQPDSASDSDRERTGFHGLAIPAEDVPDAGASGELGPELNNSISAIAMLDSDPVDANRDEEDLAPRTSLRRSDTNGTHHLSSPETDGEDMMDVEEPEVEEVDAERERKVLRPEEEQGDGEGGGGPMEV